MSEAKKDYTCPLCNSAFVPTAGMTADDFIAMNIITFCAEIQSQTGRDNRIDGVCIRCGHSMIPGVLRNSLSRHFDVYICSECGNDEAMRAYKGTFLSPASWWIVKEILSGR